MKMDNFIIEARFRNLIQARLLELGWMTYNPSADVGGVDWIMINLETSELKKIQQKGRITIDKKYLNKWGRIKEKYKNLYLLSILLATIGYLLILNFVVFRVKNNNNKMHEILSFQIIIILASMLWMPLSIRYHKNKNIKIISDGGIKYSGDLAKAFAAGADAVMIGSLFAGTDETPGKLIKRNGKLFKSFRGMGSVGAMNKGSADRYFQSKQKDTSKYVPEGVEGFAKYKGKVSHIIYKLIGGLRSSMGYLGSKQIKYLREKPKFVKITKAGFYESMVHNVDIVKSDNKY